MVRSEQLRIPVENGQRDAYLAVPEGLVGRGPAVIVVHEIWGLTDHMRKVADRFAAEGYVSLAPQLYAGELAERMAPEQIMAGMAFLRGAPPEIQRDPTKMGALLETRSPEEQRSLRALMTVMSPGQRAEFGRDLLEIARFLRTRPEVDPARVASLGFCMGGGLSARLATLDPELRACVIFYGESPESDRIPSIRAVTLGLYGGEDARITETVPGFAEAMKQAGKRFTYQIYPGAKHAFFNDTRKETYNPSAAADSWNRVLGFFRENL
jgi:carboxymethylenebutenolidase